MVTKNTGRKQDGIILTEEEAVKASEDFFKEWKAKRPPDPREWVLGHLETFREPVANGLDTQGLKDYLKFVFKVERSKTACKNLLKEVKQKLQSQPAKKVTETPLRP